MQKLKQAALGTFCVLTLYLVISINPKLKEIVSLKIVKAVTGMELSELKAFPDAPARIFVSSHAIKLDQSGHGALYVVRGPVLMQPKEFTVKVDIGEIRGEWIEIKTAELKIGDRVVIFNRVPSSLKR